MKVNIIRDRNHIAKVYVNDEKCKTYLGGNERTVFISDNYVIKFSKKKGQSHSEYERYHKMSRSDRYLFVPILEYSEYLECEYVVCPKINFKVKEDKSLLKHRDWNMLIDALVRNRIGNVWSGYNCGIDIEDRLLCYDYGL